MTHWFCQLDGAASGPFSLDELRFLAGRGKLSPRDSIRRSDEAVWTPAGTLADLFPPAAPLQHIGAAKRSSGKSTSSTAAASAKSTAVMSDSPAGDNRPPLPEREADPPTPGISAARKKLLTGTAIGAGVVGLILFLLLWFDFSIPGLSGATAAPVLTNESGPSGGRSVGVSGVSGNGRSSGHRSGIPTEGERIGATAVADHPALRNAEPAAVAPADESPSEPEPDTATLFTLRRLKESAGSDGGDGGAGGAGAGSGGEAGSEFFGLRADGSRFVYIVDCSGSMAGRPFQKACEELKASITKLNDDQHFYVFFFSSQSFPMFHPQGPEAELIPATEENTRRLEEWVNEFVPTGGTEPEEALLRALQLQPEAVYLLTDGSFDDNIVRAVRAANTGRVMINTIGFMNPAGERLLQQLARENRGRYRFVP